MAITEQVKDGDHFRIHTFGSIHELVQFIETAPKNDVFQGKECYSHLTGEYRTQFTGTKSFEEALKMLSEGWAPEAAKLAEKVPVKTVTDTVKNTRPSYNVVGYQASVPRYLQGIPTNMVDRKPSTTKQKIITLNKSLSYSCDISTEEIEREGIKALQIIQALEGLGYRVKMNMVWLVYKGCDVFVSRVTIKSPEERFSLSKMAFPLIHPSMLRRIAEAVMEASPAITNPRFVGSYGTPCDYRFSEIADKGEYLLPAHIGNVQEFVNKIIPK